MSATLAMLARDSGSHGVAVFMVVVVVVGIVVVWIWGLVDALLVPDDSLYRSGSKVMWVCLIILLGVIGAVIYAAAGSPTREDRLRYAGNPTPLSDVKSQNGHEVFAIDGFYTCAADDCDFETSSITEAKRHQRSGGRVAPQVSQPAALVPSVPAVAPATSEMKACPDCAEEVRAAARKCRFCGYMFAESAEVSG